MQIQKIDRERLKETGLSGEDFAVCFGAHAECFLLPPEVELKLQTEMEEKLLLKEQLQTVEVRGKLLKLCHCYRQPHHH